MDEELLISIVPRVDLVEELNVIPIDQISNFLIDSDVASVFVIVVLEVWSLWRVGKNVSCGNFLCSFCELYKPLLS